MLNHIVTQAEELLRDTKDFNIDISFTIETNFPADRRCRVHISFVGEAVDNRDAGSLGQEAADSDTDETEERAYFKK